MQVRASILSNPNLPKKTGEYHAGIGRLWAQQTVPEEMKDYLSAVRAENTGKQLVRYPGSPQLVRRLVRAQDRLQLSELHGSDFEVLHELFVQDKQVSIAKEDGLLMLEKKLPPIQKRGFILIDPSYEVRSDYNKVVDVLEKAHHHFATGIYALWYPVIDRELTERLLLRLKATGIPKQLRIEHAIAKDGAVRGMTASGMLFINPPWQLESQARTFLPWLNQVLTDGHGQWQVEWQVPESVAEKIARN